MAHTALPRGGARRTYFAPTQVLVAALTVEGRQIAAIQQAIDSWAGEVPDVDALEAANEALERSLDALDEAVAALAPDEEVE